jgi:hypothetical protein
MSDLFRRGKLWVPSRKKIQCCSMSDLLLVGAGSTKASGSSDPIKTLNVALAVSSFTSSLGAYTGDGQSSPTWNPINSTPVSSGLVNSDGSSISGVTLSYTRSGTYSSGVVTPPIFQYFFLVTSSSTQTFTIAGLLPSKSYLLYLYGQNGGFESRGCAFSITTGSGSPQSGSNAQTVNAATSTYILNTNYVIFNVTTNSSGTLTISYTTNGSTGTEGDFNGFQLIHQ